MLRVKSKRSKYSLMGCTHCLLLFIILLNKTTSESENSLYSFECSSRQRDVPFTPEGPPVQYIHVPKAAGSTIQAMITKIANQTHLTKNMKNGGESVLSTSLSDGVLYLGHQSIGWRTFEQLDRAFYIVSLREPYSKLVSLYDFKVTYRGKTTGIGNRAHKSQVLYLKEQEDLMRKRGIHENHFLYTLIMNDDPVVFDLAKISQAAYLVPVLCLESLNITQIHNKSGIVTDATHDDADSLVASALRNLLRIDIVVLTERLEAVEPQLRFHAPFIKMHSKLHLPHRNPSQLKRPKQLVLEEARERLLCVPELVIDNRVYDFARRVAHAREVHARNCLESMMSSECLSPCKIEVTSRERDLLNGPQHPKCDVAPPHFRI